jgi:hypothetical protein
VIGVAAAGTVAWVLGSDDDGSAAPAESTTTTAPLSDEAEELLERLERGRQGALHVRLEAATEAEAAEGSLAVEIWRDGDLVRQDVLLSAPGVRTELSVFQLPDGNVLCQRAAEAEWVCERSASLATESGDPAGIVEAAAANLNRAQVTVTDDEIAGTAVRCYEITGSGEASTMCVTEDGVPMRLAVQGQELTATDVEREVDPAVFEPPAEVTDPS